MSKIKHTGFCVALICCFVSTVFADFCQFVSITKDNMAEHKISIHVTGQKDQNFVFQIKAPMVDEDMHAWLVTSKTKLDSSKQDFRNVIWNLGQKREDVVGYERIIPSSEGVIQITLDKNKISNYYLYIDYPHELLDGGFYYSIDLSLFIEKKI